MMLGHNRHSHIVADLLPTDSVGVEIGVWRGESSAIFLNKCRHLHLVDSWSIEAYRDSDENGGFEKFLKKYAKVAGPTEREIQSYYETVFREVRDRFRSAPVTIHRMTSSEFFDKFDDRVDWIYIDGSHSYSLVFEDLKGATAIADKVFGDDYHNPDVRRAVDEFASAAGMTVVDLGSNQFQLCN